MKPPTFFDSSGKQNLLSVKELAVLLSISEKTIYGWTYARKIPFLKIGPRLVRFKIEDIEQWILSQKEESTCGN